MPDYEVDHSDENNLDMSLCGQLTNESLRRLSREKTPVTRFDYNECMAHHYAFMMKVAAEQEPESFMDVVRDPRWMEAMDKEMQDLLVDNNPWDFVAPPPLKTVISCRWLYKIKHNVDSSINRYSR